MDYKKFSKSLNDSMGLPNNKTPEQIATAVTNAYNFACVGSCRTTFGAVLLKGDSDGLKRSIKSAFITTKPFTNELQIKWEIFANAFQFYWIFSKFTPLPAPPPCTAPNTLHKDPGVMCSGNIVGYNKFVDSLKAAWKKTVFKDFVDYFYDSLLQFHMGMQGVYNGIVPTPAGPTPVIIPWNVILGGSRRRSLNDKKIELVEQVPQGRGTYIRSIQLWERRARRLERHEESQTTLYQDYTKIAFTAKGGRDSGSVSNTEEQDYMIRRNVNAIDSHNHPNKYFRGGFTGQKRVGGPSDGDIKYAIDKNVAELRVVNDAYTFVIQRPNKGWATFREGIVGKQKPDGTFDLKDTMISNGFKNELTNEYDSFLETRDTYYSNLRKIALQTAYLPLQDQLDSFDAAIHDTNVYLAKKYGWKYERIPRKNLNNKGVINSWDGYYGLGVKPNK